MNKNSQWKAQDLDDDPNEIVTYDVDASQGTTARHIAGIAAQDFYEALPCHDEGRRYEIEVTAPDGETSRWSVEVELRPIFHASEVLNEEK
jgi:hypothetical protein